MYFVWACLNSSICLFVRAGTFRSKVQKQVDEYMKKYKNVVVTSSKFGKASTPLYSTFPTKCIKSYVGKEKFLYLIDFWGEQTRLEIYDEIFQDYEEMPTCTVKIIPPKCTTLVQPCDVYFLDKLKISLKE